MTTDEIINELEVAPVVYGDHTDLCHVELHIANYAADRLRTLEAERALLLDVLRAAREITGYYYDDKLPQHNISKAIDACSHIEIGEKE